jgi:hypothetical protein
MPVFLLELTTLASIRLRKDLIEDFKIFKGYDDLQASTFYNFNNTPSIGYCLKLLKTRFFHGIDSRKFFFSQRVIVVWNSLDEDIIACDS